MHLRRFTAGFICLVGFLVSAIEASERYWVFFGDKGVGDENHEEELLRLRSEWPERSLQRRIRNGVGLNSADLPLNEPYLKQVEEAGAILCRSSRWLNAVSVYADTASLKRITNMPIVEDVRPIVSSAVNDLSLQPGAMEGDDSCRRTSGVDPIPLGAYGQSFWQAHQAGVIEVHRRGITGEGVLLGMLDTGFDLGHRAFSGLEVVGQYDVIFNDLDPSYDPRTDPAGQSHHGTACLSVIAGYDPGQLVGIAPNVAAAVAKTEMTGSETQVEEDYWITGLEWLESLGVDIVSSSLSYRSWYGKNDYNGITPPVTRAAQRACELGVVICNSAGNAGPQKITIGAPADAHSVLAIAALDSLGEPTGFSSRGPSSDGRIKPDVGALGKDVVCVKPMTWKDYSRWNGTSLSCPIVAGVAALVISAHPDWHADLVREAIRETADRTIMPDNTYGHGLVNALEAVDYPSVAGRISLLEGGKPIPGVKLQLISNYGIIETVADAGGWYRFANVDDGVYSLRLSDASGTIFEKTSLIVPPSLPFDVVVSD